MDTIYLVWPTWIICFLLAILLFPAEKRDMSIMWLILVAPAAFFGLLIAKLASIGEGSKPKSFDWIETYKIFITLRKLHLDK